MNCQQFRDVLDCYVDGELSAPASSAADAHRRECTSCDRATARLLEMKAAVNRTVAATKVPPHLEAQVRAAVAPAWKARLHLKPARRPARVALAVAAVLVAAVFVSAGANGGVRTSAANAMDRLALFLDDSGPVAIEGTILCRDCELEHRYGVRATCDVIGHHGAIAAEGRIWNIVEQPATASLIHDESLLGRNVHVRGRLFRDAGAVVIESYEMHGSVVVARAN